jgi:hypothetical protein
LTEIERDAGVVPVVGVTESQFVPATALFAAAVKLRTPPLPVTCTVWAGGFEPLLVKEKASDVGLTVSEPELTWKVTGIVTGLFTTPADVMVIAPV